MFSGKIFSKLKENRWKLTISIIAAIVMYFTPDHIDEWIKSTLKIFGIPALNLEPDEVQSGQ